MDKAIIIAAAAAILAMLAILPCGVAGLGVSMSLRLLLGEDIVLVADKDDDGRLSMDEVIDYLSTFGITATEEHVARFDLDDDGYLSVDELDDAMHFTGANLIRILDIDGDGLLSLQEIDDQLRINQDGLLRLIDTDHDGYLSEEEIDSAPDEVMLLIKKLPKAVAHIFSSYLSKTTRLMEKAFRNGFATLRSKDEGDTDDDLSGMTVENLVNYLAAIGKNDTELAGILESESDESLKELRAHLQDGRHRSIVQMFAAVREKMSRVWTLFLALCKSARRLVERKRAMEVTA